MITPDYLDKIIKSTENVVSENNEYLIKRIAKHIADSFKAGEDNIIMPSTIRDLHKLMDSGMVLDDIQKEVIKMLPSIRKEVRQAFLQSANEIADYETDFSKKLVQTLNNHGQVVDVEVPDYEKVGLPKTTGDLHMTATEIRKLEQVYRSTMKRVNNYCNTLPSAGQNAYIDACNRAFMKAQAGISPTVAICDAIEEMASAGIKVVNYDTGHQDHIEVAVARAVRSGINKANSEVVLTRCAELGVGYVKVSSHLGARDTGKDDYTSHVKWQGKVYKLNFDSEELKDYVPTEEEHQQNVNNGFGWMDTVNTAVKNDTNYVNNLLTDDNKNGTIKGLNRKISNTDISFKQLQEPMQLKHVRKIMKDMGIDYGKAKIKIIKDPELLAYKLCGWTNPNLKEIQLYPLAFLNREQLVKTLGHERIHYEQVKMWGTAKDHVEELYYEKGAVFSEDYWWTEYLRKVK